MGWIADRACLEDATLPLLQAFKLRCAGEPAPPLQPNLRSQPHAARLCPQGAYNCAAAAYTHMKKAGRGKVLLLAGCPTALR